MSARRVRAGEGVRARRVAGLAIVVLAALGVMAGCTDDDGDAAPGTTEAPAVPEYCEGWRDASMETRWTDWSATQEDATGGAAFVVNRSMEGVVLDGAVQVQRGLMAISAGEELTAQQQADVLAAAQRADAQSRIECGS